MQLFSLKKKVAEMEARQLHKEMDWQKIVQETKRICNLEHDFVESKWQQALDAKNQEVEHFRYELNLILETAVAMQQSQLQAIEKSE